MQLGRLIIGMASGLLLLGCSGNRERVELIVKSALKDPESAVFSERMQVNGSGQSLVACGTVNAKNAFGGYVGETPFMVWNGLVYFQTDDSPDVGACCTAVYQASVSGAEKLDQSGSRVCMNIGVGAASTAQ